jgi:hypothetical protein
MIHLRKRIKQNKTNIRNQRLLQGENCRKKKTDLKDKHGDLLDGGRWVGVGTASWWPELNGGGRS